ncbi:MAG: radical SAM protein [Candidatus Omnitrophota bacterium]
MARVLLIKPASRYYYTVSPNLGLGYLAAALRKAGHDVALLDCDKEKMTPDGFERYVRGVSYDLAGFQLYTNALASARKQVDAVRRCMKDAVIVIGGPHVSGDPRQALSYIDAADIAIIGEGERSIVEIARLTRGLLNGASMKDIPNIGYRDAHGAIAINPSSYIEDLDAIPMPAWDLIDPRSYPDAPHGTFARSFPVAPIVTSRGCPYTCTFCASFTVHGRKMRRRSAGSVIDEIVYLNRDYGVREVHIEDDNFTMGKAYAKEVLAGIIDSGVDIWISLPNGVRIDALDEEMLRLMERAGVYSFGIGIESGSDRILRKLRKDLTTGDIEEKVKLVKAHSRIRMTGFFLMGHPEETVEDIEKSIEFALRLRIDRASFSPIMPLPGSAIYEEWKRKIDIGGVDWHKFLYYQFVPSVSPIGTEVLERLLKKANMRFYMRPHIMAGLLSEIRTPYQLKMLCNRAAKIIAG